MKKHLKYLVILIAGFTLSTSEIKAQIDTVFWFGAPWVTPDHWWRDPIAFEVSTFNYPSTTVRIQQPSSTYDTTFTIGPNTLFTKYMHHMMDSLENKPADAVLHHGFKISANHPITVVYDVITRATNFYNPETYSLKGQNGMGTEFVLPFQTLWDNQTLGGDLNGDGTVTQPFQQAIVTATEDNTTIYITPRCPVVGGHPANVTYAVFLPFKGMTYNIQNLTQNTNVVGNNLAGSIVVSDKPVSVTVSDDSVNPAGGGGCHDLMGDQIVPTDVIGNEYIINRGFLNAGSNESFFVLATENFTTVTIDNGTTTTTILNQGDTYPFSITTALTYVNSDKPVYLLHMSGYGCELGEAILPPLNCAGSDTVAFARPNNQSFLLNLLCKSGAEGSFLLNGSAAPITAGAFTPVPGTGGAWMGAQISFTTAIVPVGSANLITNSTDLFSMGVINGGASTGCLYHYLSSFIRRVYTNAGNDTILCNGNPSIALNGSVTGGSTTGIWTVLDGTGTVNTPTNLTTTYAPTTSDYAQGYLTFVLSSTGNCNPVTDTMKVTFIQSPIVSAGGDNTYCTNNVGDIPVNGTLSFAAGASWSGGSGGAFASSGSLSTLYTPSPADLAQDSLVLYLTSAGSFFSCPNDQDTVVIYFTDPPVVVAGPDQVICSNTAVVDLNGSVTGASTTGQWTTTGAGSFSPSDLLLNADYNVSSTDTAVGSIYITLTSTGNGNCNAVQDSLQVTILNKPVITITSSDTVCANLSNFPLTATVTTGFTTTWTETGFGNVVAPGSLNTSYNVSPIDTANGFVDVYISTNGGICPTETDSMRVYFITPPQAFAGADQAFCENEVIQLNGTVTGGGSVSGSWTSTGTGLFSPGSAFLVTTYTPSPLDISSGGLELILTTSSAFGCNPDDDTLFVTFKTPPVASFSNTTACAGDNTSFTDLSTPSASVNSWNWDFGDFTSSIASDPIHSYTSSGTFSVTLVAGSSNGCYDTTVQSVTVHPLPIADFTYGALCEGTPVQFLDNSFISSGSITGWTYTFGDGSPTVNLEDPTHVYNGTGTFSVTLQVTSALGCIDTVVHNVNVLPRPVASFDASPNPVVVLEDVNFTDQSTGGVTGWYWNFGDSLGTNVQNPSHNYPNGGSYWVTLVVTDANGCEDTARLEILVALMPVLPTAFTPNGDGENDVFIIRGGPFNATDFNVYNNWGQLIFHTNDALVGWDGTFNGVDQPMGVFTWTFEVTIANGKVIRQTGDVTLLR
ncbi:MAG TPA: PKD domain-containing protein [Flavobacteriales bacterium]|nr:PKD domain-containing protein [Flavobacteriales bacterium]